MVKLTMVSLYYKYSLYIDSVRIFSQMGLKKNYEPQKMLIGVLYYYEIIILFC